MDQLRRDGLSAKRIARKLGVSPATVSWHLRRLGEPVQERCARRYDWDEIQRYYDAGHSVAQCQARFGFAKASWNAAVKRGAVRPRPRSAPLEELLASRSRNRTNILRRLVAEGLKSLRCESCGIEEWRDRPLSLCLHHVNGDGRDNRLENLQVLCPNCHSQTDNFSGRNRLRSAA